MAYTDPMGNYTFMFTCEWVGEREYSHLLQPHCFFLGQTKDELIYPLLLRKEGFVGMAMHELKTEGGGSK